MLIIALWITTVEETRKFLFSCVSPKEALTKNKQKAILSGYDVWSVLNTNTVFQIEILQFIFIKR